MDTTGKGVSRVTWDDIVWWSSIFREWYVSWPIFIVAKTFEDNMSLVCNNAFSSLNKMLHPAVHSLVTV
jgi:hypothetical protein